MEVEGGFVAMFHGVEDQHGVRFEFAAESRHVGERRVGAKAVVAIVVAHLEVAGGNHQAFIREEIRDQRVTGRKETGDGGALRPVRAWAPVRSDVLPELGALWLLGPVVSTILEFFLCHDPIVPPTCAPCR